MRVFLLAALLAAPAGAVDVPEGRFSVPVPRGWTASRDVVEDVRRKVFGVGLTGPKSKEGETARIRVDRYMPGNALFEDAEAFLKRNRQESPLAARGEKTGPLKKATLAGLAAQRFTRETFAYLPPGAAQPKEVAVVQDVVVAPDGRGFWAAELSAPKSEYKKAAKAFEKVLLGLKRN